MRSLCTGHLESGREVSQRAERLGIYTSTGGKIQGIWSLVKVGGQGSYGVTVIFTLPLESSNKEERKRDKTVQRECWQAVWWPMRCRARSRVQEDAGPERKHTGTACQVPALLSLLRGFYTEKEKNSFLISSKMSAPTSPSFCDSASLKHLPASLPEGWGDPTQGLSDKHHSPQAEKRYPVIYAQPTHLLPLGA